MENFYNSEKKEFLLALIHDIKNPIIALDKMLENILDESPDTPISKFEEIIKESLKSNQELLKMLEDFLAVYHCEEKTFEITPEKFSIREVLQEILDRTQYITLEKNLNIITYIDQNIPEIKAGKAEIRRVMANLIHNAINHSSLSDEIKIKMNLDNNNVVFNISNYCKSCSKLTEDVIFNLYKTPKNQLGHGLGLYISKKIIEMHHGTIGFKTDENNLITFYFSLPIN